MPLSPARWRGTNRGGDIMANGDTTTTAIITELPARYWAKVELNVGPLGCHIWRGSLSGSDGRPTIKWNGKVVYAYRLALAARLGVPVESVTCARHLVCNNPQCVNGDHLAPGTRRENTADMIAAGRSRNATTARTLGTVSVPTEVARAERDGTDKATAVALARMRAKQTKDLRLMAAHLRECAAGR